MVIYTVRNGDSLYSIARRYGTDPQILARDNGITDARSLSVGQDILILEPRTVYTVQRGDNIYSVAQSFGVSVNSILRNNFFLGGREELTVGQVLTIVPEPVEFEREISLNAYVYPSIDRAILRSMAPYLTYMTVFAYGIEENGELIEIDDEDIIELARRYGTAPIMLIAALDERGRFSNELATRVITDAVAKETLIEDIARVLTQKRYVGVEVDFEYIPAEYAAAYAEFISELEERLEQIGATVSVSLSPKNSDSQQGLLYEGHDYSALGAAADRAFLMTYEWGYAYGPPMAISPLDKVSAVVEYAVSRIPAQKLTLGIPNYGYNWTLPYIMGERRARSLGNVEANELAKEKRAAIEFDTVAAAPHFRYFDRVAGAPEEHEVWFENARSIDALARLVNTFGLDGIGIWNGMRPFPQLWQVINALYPIRKILS